MVKCFAELHLSSSVVKAAESAGYVTPTPIQEKTIPLILMNQDVCGSAQTGTGKTASFLLPMLDILGESPGKSRMPRAVILEPTRELAEQVVEHLEVFTKALNISFVSLIGGVPFGGQRSTLRKGVDIIVATPGRLLDHCERGDVLLAGIKMLVIDEADRMLDMGFLPSVESIIKMAPPTRQTIMFSATLLPEVRSFAQTFLSRPKEVMISAPRSAVTIKETALSMREDQKPEALLDYIAREDITCLLIFCNRKKRVDEVYKTLQLQGYPAGRLHGDMQQEDRQACLESFRQGEITMMVCSDVAARGLDIAAIDHVINYDVPFHAEDHVHRIGRTGRAGREGKACTFVSPGDAEGWKSVGAYTKVQLQRYVPSSSPKVPVKKAPSSRKVSASSPKVPLKKTPSSQKVSASSPEVPVKKVPASQKVSSSSSEVPVKKMPSPQAQVPFGQTQEVPAFLLRPAVQPTEKKSASSDSL